MRCGGACTMAVRHPHAPGRWAAAQLGPPASGRSWLVGADGKEERGAAPVRPGPPSEQGAQAATRGVLCTRGRCSRGRPPSEQLPRTTSPIGACSRIRCRRDKFPLPTTVSIPFPHFVLPFRPSCEPYLPPPVSLSQTPEPCLQICEVQLFACSSLCCIEPAMPGPKPTVLALSVQVQRRPWIR